jgi:tetratricopeptide (TPR) repeat protein
MSLKENVNYIKDEISNEEKFFESFFKVEKFYKKYKLLLIIIIFSILAYFIATNISAYIKNQNAIAANNAYNSLIKNPKDQNAINTLKEKNKQLLEIALYKNDKTTNVDDVIFLNKIAKFNKAINENDINTLNTLILDPSFVLKDYAIFNKALILTNKGEYKKAKDALKNISNNSQVNTLSDLLKHYLLTK